MRTICGPASEPGLTSESVERLHSRNRRLITVTALCCYGLFVICLWAWYGLRTGMPSETQLVYASQSRGVLEGFKSGDSLRTQTHFFYHLSYLLARAVGMEGSFVAYQIVYAALWFGRGALAFLIWKRLLPGFPLLAYVIGALVVFHASDTALNWVGLLNHMGFIFWMLLSFYLLVASFQQNGAARAILSGVGAAGASYMSLWTYESPLMEIVAFPVLVLLFFERRTSRNVLIAIGYCLVPVYYAFLAAARYLAPGAGSYQLSVVRTGWTMSSLARDALFQIFASLGFWRWGSTVVQLPGGRPTVVRLTFSACVFALFVVGGVAVARLSRRAYGTVPSVRPLLLKLLFSGVALLVLSLPVYLLLVPSLWRTQFLTGFGAALIFVSVGALAATVFSRRSLQVGVLLLAGGGIAIAGTVASLKTGDLQHKLWERHRAAVAGILEIAPRVKDDTVIVVLNVAKGTDPFSSRNMWFDVALTLAYPRTRVAGIFFYKDGSPASGQNMVVRSGSWQQTAGGWPTLVRETDFANTLVVELNTSDPPRLARTVPAQFAVDAETAKRYDPGAVILPGPPSPLALRRYAPIGDHRP